MNKIILILILVILGLHLFYTNSELLIAAREMYLCSQSVQITTSDKVFLTLFALTYSSMTTLAIYSIPKLIPILVFALLDGFAVYLRINYFQGHYIEITSVFYGFYTFYVVFISYLIRQKKNPVKAVENNNLVVKIENTISQKENDFVASEDDQPKKEIKYETIRQLTGAINRLVPKTPEKIAACLELASDTVKQEYEEKNK